jgi:hypothetical protein
VAAAGENHGVLGLREVKQVGWFEHDGKLEETRGVGKGKWGGSWKASPGVIDNPGMAEKS